MYAQIEQWIDCLELAGVPDDVKAFCFNLYDGCDGRSWSMELIGASWFDPENSDWPCDEVTDFASRKCEFHWEWEAEWNIVLEEALSALKAYLEKGKYANTLKDKDGVGAGFHDGDLHILYQK